MVKGTLFNKCKRIKVDPYVIPYTKINPNWIKDLNIRPKTIKFLQENRRRKVQNTGAGSDFLDVTPTAKAIK